jgi:hypothetical protein
MSAGARRGTILIVPILLLLAGVVILVGVVSVAMGRGGEMAEFATDSVPPRLDYMATAADVAMLRPPSALWGYNVQVTDEALSRVAQVITERDVEIALLRQQLAELRAATGRPSLAATLLARSKARTGTPGLDTPPGRAADARAAEVHAPEPGPLDTGPLGTGPAGPAPADAGPADAGPADTRPADTRPADTRPADTGPADTGPEDTGPAEAVPADTGSEDTVFLGRRAADSGSAGSELAGSELAAPVSGEAAAGRDD